MIFKRWPWVYFATGVPVFICGLQWIYEHSIHFGGPIVGLIALWAVIEIGWEQ
jgi:hypothetical protein